ncbi:hypothetical protein V6R21_07095 [Limibacter armeniacum]|uniref:hypothetical protein n=1 Tax=Limibacter armeniacum TaxID=466084 RepID=UPI002FE5374B
MKNKLLLFLFAMLTSASLMAQEEPSTTNDNTAVETTDGPTGSADEANAINNTLDVLSSMDSVNQFAGNLGYNYIGGEHYVTLRLKPEITLGKWGVGLDIPLSVNVENGKFRSEEFKNGVGALRMIRYVRYGVKKRDPFHIQVGDMSNSYIGYGMLVNNYTNATSFERRKVGLGWDVRFGKVAGLEGMYSDFNVKSFNLLAVRPYVRPFGNLPVPVIRTFEIGGTYVGDRDKTVENGLEVQHNLLMQNKGINSYGADAGISLINLRFLRLRAYGQFAKLDKKVSIGELTAYNVQHMTAANNELPTEDQITEEDIATNARNQAIELAKKRPEYEGVDDADFENGYTAFEGGQGYSYGIELQASLIFKLLTASAKIERVNYERNFIPQFFNSIYEINKDARILALANVTEPTKGIYGSVSATLLEKVRLSGALMLPDEIGENAPAMVNVNAEVVNLFDKIILNAHYIKGNLLSLDNAFTFDENSLAVARAAYKLNRFLTVGVDYQWTWQQVGEGQFKPSNRVMPYFGFNFPLNL